MKIQLRNLFLTTSISLTASIIIEYNPSNSCCLSVGRNGRKILHVFLKSKVGCCLNPIDKDENRIKKMKK